MACSARARWHPIEAKARRERAEEIVYLIKQALKDGEQAPFFSSAEAAQGWLAAFPDGRVFPVREAWDLSPISDLRNRMLALLNLAH
jgi:hypothetical protein